MTDKSGSPLLTRIFDAMTPQRRRYVLYYLRDHGEAETADIALQVAAWEHDIPKDGVTEQMTESLEIDLVHSHLPKLEDYDIVSYDKRTNAASYAYPPTPLNEIIRLAASFEKP
jgi:hypothetical protein